MSISYELRARMALEKHGFRNTHSLGQNFIFDESLLSHLLDMAGITPYDKVLEIGPGAGMMTALLSDRCSRVLSIEIDEKLKPVLEEVLGDRDNSKIVFADAMRADIAAVTKDFLGEGSFRVVANLPYYITTDVLLRLVAGGLEVDDVCVMVQKEAADRIMSRPGGKQWCAMAAEISYFGCPEILCDVPRGCFEPQPHVDSVFLRIAMYKDKPVQAQSDYMMRRVITSAFLMRRKKLANNLKASFAMTAEEAQKVISEAGLDENVRGEALSLGELALIADIIAREKGESGHNS